MRKLVIVLLITAMLLAIPAVSAANSVDKSVSVIGTDGAINSLFQDKNINDKFVNSFNNNEDFRNLVIKLGDAGLFDSSNLFPVLTLDLDFNLVELDFF